MLDQAMFGIKILEQLTKGIKFKIPNEESLFVRWMKTMDLSEVHEIERQTFPDAWSLDSFSYKLKNKNFNLSLVGFIEETLAAYTVSYAVDDELHFNNIAVKEEFRKMKIGELLLKTSLQLAKENNCLWAYLEVREKNEPAIRLYHKFGFAVVGIRKKYYKEENEDAMLMSKLI